MITTKTLLENSRNFGNNGANIRIEFDPPAYDVSQKKLTFKGMADSSDPKKKYNVHIAFFDIDMTYEDFLSGNWNLTKEILLDKPLKVDCKCKAYEMSGCLKGNLQHDCALYTHAEFTHYEKKTDRPEKNPENIPMGCKHIYSAIEQILSEIDNIKQPSENLN